MNAVSSTLFAAGLMIFFTGCSSPPKPVPVDFKQTPEEINTQLPRLILNPGTIKSARADGPWTLTLNQFNGDRGSYDTVFYYALAHADRIDVASQNPGDGERARQWLLRHGATAPVQIKAGIVSLASRTCVTDATSPQGMGRVSFQIPDCENTSITFYKYAEVKE